MKMAILPAFELGRRLTDNAGTRGVSLKAMVNN